MAGLVGVPLSYLTVPKKLKIFSVHCFMPCQKRKYKSKKGAKRALKALNKEHNLGLTICYYCTYCSSWHHSTMEKKKARIKSKQGGHVKPVVSQELLELRKAVIRSMFS